MPIICDVSCPLPAISRVSPPPKAAMAVFMASSRGEISCASGQPLRISARMAAGSSLRGLSSVIIISSASLAAIAPIFWRLVLSRSPPQPNTTFSLSGVCARKASSATSSASGVWAKSIIIRAPAGWPCTGCIRPRTGVRAGNAPKESCKGIPDA